MVIMAEIDCFISSISSALVKRSDNYWSASNEAVVSYPEDAHSFFEPIEENSYWFAHRNSCIISAIRRFPPDGWVIDVGGGNGFVSLCLKNQEIKTIVMEPGPGAHTALGRGLPVIKASLESAQFYDNSVPAIGMFDVLEHIEGDRNALLEIHRVLRPGGYLYLTVPAFQWLWSGEDRAAGHSRRYTIRSLTSVLDSSGFDMKFSTYMFYSLVLPILVLRSIPSLFGKLQARGHSKKSD